MMRLLKRSNDIRRMENCGLPRLNHLMQMLLNLEFYPSMQCELSLIATSQLCCAEIPRH